MFRGSPPAGAEGHGLGRACLTSDAGRGPWRGVQRECSLRAAVPEPGITRAGVRAPLAPAPGSG
ncbi:hypothetical protein SUDANB70_05269 [Streptomyces sp. enrichment culture]